jgi:hypothetical protein
MFAAYNIIVLVCYPNLPIISAEGRTFHDFFWFFIERKDKGKPPWLVLLAR